MPVMRRSLLTAAVTTTASKAGTFPGARNIEFAKSSEPGSVIRMISGIANTIYRSERGQTMKPTKKAAIVAFLITAAVVALSIVSAASAVWGS